jgi:hypothetical protein
MSARGQLRSGDWPPRCPRCPQHRTRRDYSDGSVKCHKARPLAGVQKKEAGRSQLRGLRSFLRISLRSSAYSSTIRRASCVREGLLGGFGLEAGSCGITERTFEV